MDAASWIADWWAWSVPSTLQATVLLGLAWIADRLLARRAWPQLLVLCWLLALARFFLPPGLRSPISVTAALGQPTLAAAELAPSADVLIALFAAWLAGASALVVLRVARRARLRARVELVTPSREWGRTLDRAARDPRKPPPPANRQPARPRDARGARSLPSGAAPAARLAASGAHATRRARALARARPPEARRPVVR